MAARTAERKDFLASVLVTAVEGGINYWAEVKDYEFSDAGDSDLMLSDASVDLRESDDDYKGPWHHVTLDSIAHGIARILDREHPMNHVEDGFRKMVAGANAVNDACDIDAGAADAILQAGVLNEIRYG